MKLYKITRYARHNVADHHYHIVGGLSKDEVIERYNFLIDPEDFNDAVESGYLGKDSLNEYEIDEEFII